MATLLLIAIYISYIGLGIPDSLLGAAWPAIYTEFGLPVSGAGYVTMLISVCTAISSLVSARLVNRFSTRSITAASTALTAVALLGISFSPNIYWLCLFAIPMGFGAGAIDSTLNNYVALNYSATQMNFLHCFYGIGVSVSPYLMSLALRRSNMWRMGYRVAFYIQFAIMVIAFVTLPLWNKVKENRAEEEVFTPVTLSYKEMVKMPSVVMVWLCFMTSCAIESLCTTWGSTFLVNSKGMSADAAAEVVTLYYVGLTLGRFCSGLFARRIKPWGLIKIGEGIVLISIIMLMLPLPPSVAGISLFVTGFGIGPVFPNFTHLTPVNFGKEISQSIIGSQMALTYVSIMLTPVLFGEAAEKFSTDVFPYFALAVFALLVFSTALLIRILKKENRYNAH